jgi:hypothetical protein
MSMRLVAPAFEFGVPVQFGPQVGKECATIEPVITDKRGVRQCLDRVECLPHETGMLTPY